MEKGKKKDEKEKRKYVGNMMNFHLSGSIDRNLTIFLAVIHPGYPVFFVKK